MDCSASRELAFQSNPIQISQKPSVSTLQPLNRDHINMEEFLLVDQTWPILIRP